MKKFAVHPLVLMTNSSSHPDNDTAIALLKEDIQRARKLETPEELIAFATTKALEWRQILIRERGRPEWATMRDISKEELR